MFLFPCALYYQWITEGNMDCFIWANFSNIFELSAVTPSISFQGNRYNRHFAASSEFNPERIKLFGIEINTTRRLRKNDDGHVGIYPVSSFVQNCPEILPRIVSAHDNRVTAPHYMFEKWKR